ncbi:MAG TPA: enterobactin synthase subunit EntD [Scandinavium sp.]|jgi:enterobactin synthetase component D
MQTHHSTFTLARLTVHRIDFDPTTFTDADLLWLPHHIKLLPAGKKRKAEHLAGRLAAFYALREQGLRQIPNIGDNRQPLWRPGWYGSISHSGTTAVAVVAREAVGIDLEGMFSAELSQKIANSIINSAERALLEKCGLPFPLALALVFSAKESLYKALSFTTDGQPGFASAQIVALNGQRITLQVDETFSPALVSQCFDLVWQQDSQRVITLLAKTLEPA